MDALRAVDVVARFAEAWDGRGRHALTPPWEHRALVAMAGMRVELAGYSWRQLSPADRSALIHAAGRLIPLARTCAWCFGEGQGA